MFRWGVQWGEGSKGVNVRGIEGEQRGKHWGGELNGMFLQFEFRFLNALGQARPYTRFAKFPNHSLDKC